MYTDRINHFFIENSLKSEYITAILGPRRVGKTSFVEHYIKQHPANTWVCLNMDKMEQRLRIKDLQLETLIVEMAKKHIGDGKIWVIVDEAQKCPELFDQIKILYDKYKDKNKIKFVLTGSAMLSLHRLSTESLAGRIEINHLYEFNLRESARLIEPSIPFSSLLDILLDHSERSQVLDVVHSLLPYKQILEKQLSHQLVWGGLPELLTTDEVDKKNIYLNNYLQTYLEKDIRAIESISDINLYRNMMDVLAEQTGSLRDDLRIVQALDCKRDTLKKYRGYLEATLLYYNIYPYIGNSLKRLVKSPKGYLANNGLISILTGVNALDILKATGSVGHRLENWFLNEMNTWAARTPVRTTIDFWRTSTGVEVDFVIVKRPKIFPFEVTFSSNINKDKVRSLKIFLENEPKAKWAYYIYRGEFKIDEENKIMFIPCWAIA